MTAAGHALLVVDLQNEFLHEDGHFPAHPDSRGFLSNISAFVPTFRDAGGLVVWVISEYGTVDEADVGQGTSDPLLPIGDTHRGRTPCCVPGSHGALLYTDAEVLVDTQVDLRVTKKWYSSFRSTGLCEVLCERGVDKVILCGLLSNVCVLASARDALHYSFETTVLTDCLGWRRQSSHTRALDLMSNMDLRLQTAEEAIIRLDSTTTI
ncbi:Isochorismatase hydrolase [Exidia glandulosa HHB12029]|uniref:Isochorismatase hydrolase n=1 Tax=Exidia glandulosa HHB12029 TaxID=1314781 RepID=A0A165R2V3_EXIGL|nr:Isochorismatase hydrolase [Exidia glandulosa HHB12029]